MKFIESYVHNGRVGVLVELAIDTSFTAAMEEFKQLAKDLALQIAAFPIASVEALMDETFVKDNSSSVAELIASASARLGERIAITRFVRWDVAVPEEHAPEPSGAPAVVARAPRVA